MTSGEMKRKVERFSRFALVPNTLAILLLLGICSFHADAQFIRGTILGTVTDSGGSVVPEAEITLQNQETNESRTLRSDMTGAYTFSALLPGLYRLEARCTGFKTQVLTDIRLDVNQTARFDLKLSVGQVT